MSIEKFFENPKTHEAFNLLRNTFYLDNQIFIFGNGGSASMAIHFSTDWSKGVHEKTGRAMRVNCLNSNLGLLTAVANDLSFQDSASYQLKLFSKPNDLLFLISSSGKSKNIITASKMAKELGLLVIALTGQNPSNYLEENCDVIVKVNIDDTQIIEDVHNSFGHLVLKLI